MNAPCLLRNILSFQNDKLIPIHNYRAGKRKQFLALSVCSLLMCGRSPYPMGGGRGFCCSHHRFYSSARQCRVISMGIRRAVEPRRSNSKFEISRGNFLMFRFTSVFFSLGTQILFELFPLEHRMESYTSVTLNIEKNFWGFCCFSSSFPSLLRSPIPNSAPFS